jgi:sugar O-acyltransferase (sialic acid O-acetyltransferase NeuD family)
MTDTVIVGARGSGLKALQILEDRIDDGDRSLNIIGFVDDDPGLVGEAFYDYPVLGDGAWLAARAAAQSIAVVCAIGDPLARHKAIGRLSGTDAAFPNAIHPSAQVSRRAVVGHGNLMSQNVVLQAGVRVGDFNAFNMAAVFGPLAEVRSYCTINSQVMLASGTIADDYCYVGMGAKVNYRLHLGRGTKVGANAFVTKSTDPWTTVFGLPAKVIRRGSDPFADSDAENT